MSGEVRSAQVAPVREAHLLAMLPSLTVFITLIFLPAALRYQFSFNSLAPGILLSCALLCAIAATGLLGRLSASTLSKGWMVGLVALLFILLHLGISLFASSADLNRAFASLAALGLVLLVPPIVYQVVYRSADSPLSDTLAIIKVALLVMTGLALLGIQPVALLASERPIWPFTEPSHYALAATPFLIDACIRSSRIVRWVWLGIMAALVLLLKSVVLGVATVIAAVCCLGLLEIVIFAVLAALVPYFVDLTYFSDRIAISYDSSNLSALIYLQGIELIQEALEKTGGWGIGFQQLGFAPTNVLATEMIRRVGGGEQNLADGSFLAVKLGAEFGVIGLLVMAVFLWKLFSAIIHLRLIANGKAISPVGVTFALCVYVAFFVEVFVRGVGYFSGTAILAFTSFGVVHLVKFMSVKKVGVTAPVMMNAR